ncbi:MAG: hypothetical protein ACI9DF_001828 [Verrucomicrobiales bacterium]|jgi:hypothetical protein
MQNETIALMWVNQKGHLSTFILLSLSLALVASAKDETTIVTDDASLWDMVDIYSDFRLRYEVDFDSVRADGVTAREDRHRLRMRARLGLKIAPTEILTFDVRLRYGDSNSQQSPHVTLWQNEGDYGDQSDVWIDRFMLRFAPENFAVQLGRMGLPFWQAHELYWDEDVFLDGTSLAYTAPLGDHTTMDFVAGTWLLPDGPDDHDFSERSLLAASQVKLTHEFSNIGTLTIANSLLFVEDNSAVVNRTNDDINYAINALDLQYKTSACSIPLTIGATWIHNFNEGPSGDIGKNETEGFALYGAVGALARKGDWLLGYHYADIGKYAVARFLAEDDWDRFGTATQTRSSDFRGHELRIGYSLADNLNLIVRAFHVDTITTREDGNRLRLDLNYKF